MINNNPNPTTDSFDDVEARHEMERKEASYPKKEDGSIDIGALSPEESSMYWKDRHDASTRGFHSFKAKTDAEKLDLANKLEILEKSRVEATPSTETVTTAVNTAETLDDFEKQIPNFDLLDIDTQENLRAIFSSMDARLERRLSNDPGVAMARQTYNEQKWDKAFDAVSSAFGQDLVANKADFKSKYFKAHNVPENISEILTTLAKGYLYDMKIARGNNVVDTEDRIDLERGNGGMKETPVGMSIDDWVRLQQTNPKAFAKRSKEYNDAMASGKLSEE